jgi:hypothetical protein
MAMGLLYKLRIMVKCVCYTGLWIHWFRDLVATIPNGSVTIGRNVISWCGPLVVGFDRATNVTYGMLYNGWSTGIVL